MKTAIIIPCFNVENHIISVIESVLFHGDIIICVNDSSSDNTGNLLDELSRLHKNLVVFHRLVNGGVGAAMLDGYKLADDHNMDFIVKLDGDGQMDANYISSLIKVLKENSADFVKGNRFNDFSSLQKMPFVRRIGNLGMSFLIKAASGYWDVFDPANGFYAMRTSLALKLNKNRISNRYFFESSQIIELYYHGTRIRDISMPAIYGTEKSNLSVKKVLLEFPPKIFKAFMRRILLRYYILDINIASFYIFFGSILFGWGCIFGLIKWNHYRILEQAAPTGTVILSTLTIVLGFQLLLAAINYDIEKGKIVI